MQNKSIHLTKRTKIHITIFVCLLLAALWLFCLLQLIRLKQSTTETLRTDDYWYEISKLDAHVCVYYWNGSDSGRIIEIPDTIDGRKITTLGYGNAPFLIESLEVYPPFQALKESLEQENTDVLAYDYAGTIAYDDDLLEFWDGEIIYYDFTLKIGPNITSIYSICDDITEFNYEEHTALINRVYIECDPSNEKFYSENGILYNRSDDSVVNGFWYQNGQ